MEFFKSYWKALVWAVVIIGLSLISANRIPDINAFKIPQLDKIAHFIMYFLLTFLLVDGHASYFHNTKVKKAILPSITISIVFGLFMEFMQSTITTSRHAEFLDFAANTIGAIIGGITSLYLLNILAKKLPVLFKTK